MIWAHMYTMFFSSSKVRQGQGTFFCKGQLKNSNWQVLLVAQTVFFLNIIIKGKLKYIDFFFILVAKLLQCLCGKGAWDGSNNFPMKAAVPHQLRKRLLLSISKQKNWVKGRIRSLGFFRIFPYTNALFQVILELMFTPQGKNTLQGARNMRKATLKTRRNPQLRTLLLIRKFP